MNKKQKMILAVGAGVVVMMMLFPPFQFHTLGGATFNKGYAFILDPPELNDMGDATVNSLLLLVQWVGVGVVSASLWFVAKNKNQT